MGESICWLDKVPQMDEYDGWIGIYNGMEVETLQEIDLGEIEFIPSVERLDDEYYFTLIQQDRPYHGTFIKSKIYRYSDLLSVDIPSEKDFVIVKDLKSVNSNIIFIANEFDLFDSNRILSINILDKGLVEQCRSKLEGFIVDQYNDHIYIEDNSIHLLAESTINFTKAKTDISLIKYNDECDASKIEYNSCTDNVIIIP